MAMLQNMSGGFSVLKSRTIGFVIALVLICVAGLPFHFASMSTTSVTAQTGVAVSLDDILNGTIDLQKSACLNGTDSGQNADDTGCTLCCAAPPLHVVEAPQIAQLLMSVILAVYASTPTYQGTGVPPQAYLGRAPPFSV